MRGACVVWTGGLGPVQLRDARQLLREALVVPRAYISQCGRVPAQLGDQRQLPGAGEREQPWPAEYQLAVRGPRLPLQDQRGRRWQGEFNFAI